MGRPPGQRCFVGTIAAVCPLLEPSVPGNYLASMSRMLCCQRKISWHILSERDDIPMLSKKIMHFLKGLEKLPLSVHYFLSLYGSASQGLGTTEFTNLIG